MKCPYSKTDPVQCEYVDTAGMDKPVECNTCKRYPNPITKLYEKYPLKQMLDMLPKSLIKEQKKLFKIREVFDLNITRDALDNWHIVYENSMSLIILFRVLNPDIHWCAAEMIAVLIENKYLKP
jgi:hypothetical protein